MPCAACACVCVDVPPPPSRRFKPQYWSRERVEAYLQGVPDDKMLVLDLISEATPGYEATRAPPPSLPLRGRIL